MRKETVLRKFGWKLEKGKWTAPNHSRPLTTKQAGNALARDLGAKDFPSLAKKPKYKEIKTALDSGYRPRDQRGKTWRKEGKGGKSIPLSNVAKRIKETQRKQAREAEKAKLARIPFKAREFFPSSIPDKSKLDSFRKRNEELVAHFIQAYNDNNDITFDMLADDGQYDLYRLIHGFKNGKTKKERQRALNDLLILCGLRSGNESWVAGETPKKG